MEDERPPQADRKPSEFLKRLLMGTDGEKEGLAQWQRVGMAALWCILILRSVAAIVLYGLDDTSGTGEPQEFSLLMVCLLEVVYTGIMILYGVGLLLLDKKALAIQRVFLVVGSVAGLTLGPAMLVRGLTSDWWSVGASPILGLVAQVLYMGVLATVAGGAFVVLAVRTMRTRRVSLLAYVGLWWGLAVPLGYVFDGDNDSPREEVEDDGFTDFFEFEHTPLPEIIARLDDPEVETRRNAVVALGNVLASALGEEEETEIVVEALAKALDDSAADVRRDAAQSLRGRTIPSGLVHKVRPGLERLVASDDEALRRDGALALGMIEPESDAVGRVLLQYANQPRGMELPMAVLLGMKEKYSKPALKKLLADLESPDAEVRRRAAGVPLHMARYQVKRDALAEAVPVLAEALLKEEDAGVRTACASGLYALGDMVEPVRGSVREALDDPDDGVRAYAYQIMAHIGAETEDLPLLVAGLACSRRNGRVAAGRALAGLGPEGVQILTERLSSEDRNEVEAALVGLIVAGKDAQSAIEAIRPIIEGEDGNLKYLAKTAVKEIEAGGG